MEDILSSVKIYISLHDQNYPLWDKNQLFVIIRRTKWALEIFLGYEERTLDTLI